MNLLHLSPARVALTGAFLATAVAAQAFVLEVDFSSYTDGALAGQNGWAQYNTQSTNPIVVTSGKVTWAPGSTTNDQDVFLPFSAQVTQPAEGSATLYYGLKITVATPGTSYFAALNTLTTSTTSGNFQNARIAAMPMGDGFAFSGRVNGQPGYPFSTNGAELDLGVEYTVVARLTLLAGNANDVIDLFVAPSSQSVDFNTIYATATYSTGGVTDPAFGAIVLSQFGSGTVSQAGVSIGSVIATDEFSAISTFSAIPEPSAFAALAGLAVLGCAASRRRRRA